MLPDNVQMYVIWRECKNLQAQNKQIWQLYSSSSTKYFVIWNGLYILLGHS